MHDGDSQATAGWQTETIQDAGVWQGWDGSRNIGELFGENLGLREIAWDVHLICKPGIKWEGPQPPRPTFWMHQLLGVDPRLLFCENPTRLAVNHNSLAHRTLLVAPLSTRRYIEIDDLFKVRKYSWTVLATLPRQHLPEGFFTSQAQFPALTSALIRSATVERPVSAISSPMSFRVKPKQ